MKKTLAILTAALMASGAAVAAPTTFGDDASFDRTAGAQLLLAQSIADPTDPSDDDDSPDAQVLEEGDDSENAGERQRSTGQDGIEVIEEENSPEESFGDESPEGQVTEEGADSGNAGDAQSSTGQDGIEIIEEENAPEEGFGDESPESGSAPDTVD